MNEGPGLEETIKDIEITKSEAEAYRKLESGFYTLASLPDASQEDMRIFSFNAQRYGDSANRCERFLEGLIEYKKELEGLK